MSSVVSPLLSCAAPLTMTLAPTRMVVNKFFRVHRPMAVLNVCGKVALTKMLCLLGGAISNRRVNCSSNPICNIMSASSNTNTVTRTKDKTAMSIKSNNRPHVPTTMSMFAPRNNSSTCASLVPRPPTNATQRIFAFFFNRNRRVQTSTTCVANSRVGTQTNPLGADALPSPPLVSPSRSCSSFMCRMYATAGKMYAKVLPLPVGATAIMSNPHNAAGHNCR